MPVARLSANDALKLRKMAEAQRELATLLTTLLEYIQSVEARLKALEAAIPLPPGEATCADVPARHALQDGALFTATPARLRECPVCYAPVHAAPIPGCGCVVVMADEEA
jgi:hypothetical protein